MSLTMTETEQKQIDSKLEQMMDWANSRKAEAEQLALDSARLMSCTSDRMDRLKKQGFFKRCWDRFSGAAGEMERANNEDLIRMQKMSFRYLNMIQEQQVLMAHSMLSLKNNLLSLAVKEEETRGLVTLLAQKTLERFKQLETRVDQLEVSTNLQGWLLGLEERDYDEKIPTEYMRLFRVLNDFYSIKSDEWNYNDLMFMRKAIRTVGINPKKKLSLNAFINGLTDEIQSEAVGFASYGQAITSFKPESVDNYSKFVLDNISSPVYVSMHGLKMQYMDRLDMVEELQDEMKISASEALKRLLRRSIANLNVNLDYEFPLAETAIEILGCIRLTNELISSQSKEKAIIKKKIDTQLNSNKSANEANYNKFSLGEWHTFKSNHDSIDTVTFENGSFYAAFYNDSYEKTVICNSNDLTTWNDLFEIPHSYCPEHIDEIRYLDNKLILKSNNRLFISEDMVNYRISSLDDHYKGYRIIYDGSNFNRIFYVSDIWYVIGMFKTDFDSRIIIFSGSDIDNLNQYTTLDSFGTTYLSNESFTIDYSSLYLLLNSRSDISDSYLIKISGLKHESRLFKNGKNFKKIYCLNGNLYMAGDRCISIKKFNDESHRVVNTSYNSSSHIKVFQNSNLAICKGYYANKLYITNDFVTMNEIDVNFSVNENFTFGNGMLVIWSSYDDFDIKFCRII